MNILFLLTPKRELEFVYEDYTIRQIMEKMNHYKFSVIPVLKESGEYLATVSDGDILRFIHKCDFDKDIAENKRFSELDLHRPYKSLPVTASTKEVIAVSMNQNFIPIVDDRNIFIGIIKRSDIIKNAIIEFAEN